MANQKVGAKLSQALLSEGRNYAKEILAGLNASPSHFHAVNYCKDRLQANGFERISETEPWNLEKGKGYYFTRNGSTICAFLTGAKCSDEHVKSFKIIGCHTDSPVLKIAPRSKISKHGYNQLNVMTYGGGLWRTWFDRDLSLAGKVVVKQSDGTSQLLSKYWDAGRPLLKIPSLAIHLDTERDKFQPNKETHLKPIIATSIANDLFGDEVIQISDDTFNLEDRHLSNLTQMMAKDLDIRRDDIVDFELNLYDSQPSCLMGLHEEFVSSPRLDNLGSSLCSLDALIQHSKRPVEQVRNHSEIDMIMLFDHEEVGSTSAQGADSNMAAEITQRVFGALSPSSQSGSIDSQDAYYQAIHRSLLLSADMAHGVHPNYPEKHQAEHQPRIHEGIVLKINANQRYMTDSVGSSVLKMLAREADVPLQEFIVRNDSLCGSTIGPMMAAKAGLKTIDIGAPQLAMHSIRETCGVVDLLYYKRLFGAFFESYYGIASHLLSE